MKKHTRVFTLQEFEWRNVEWHLVDVELTELGDSCAPVDLDESLLRFQLTNAQTEQRRLSLSIPANLMVSKATTLLQFEMK